MIPNDFGPAFSLDDQSTQPSADATLHQVDATAREECDTLSPGSTGAVPPASLPTNPTSRKVGAYVIDSDVPMPDFQNHQARGRYPFAQLKVGESVVIRDVEEKTLDGARRSWLVRRGIDLRKVRVEGGFRVFRVA